MKPVLICLCVLARLAAEEPDRATLEKQFQETMTGVILEGQSTRDGREGLSKDKYTIDKIVKQSGDTWTFYTRVQYGGKDVTMPLPITVKWAGDTPVITVTDQGLPGMGTYSARVVIYKGNYAGTWSGGDHGGKLFGKIVKQP
jgi:hypothetical protein